MQKNQESESGIGHNSGEVSGALLKSFIERVERLEEEKKALSEDIRNVYSEAKSTGFEPKIMKKLIKIRKQPLEKRRQEQDLLELYAAAIQMELDL